MSSGESKESPSSYGTGFSTTHWSVVLSAVGTPSEESRCALGVLCEKYWRPLYAFVRRQGHSREEAQDLIQEFFTRLIEKNSLQGVDRERGKFRTYLLGALKHFLADEWDRTSAKKRGGTLVHLSLDYLADEENHCPEPSHDLSPDKLYEQKFALSVLANAMEALRTEYGELGKGYLYERLKAFLPGEPGRVHYAELGVELGMSESAVKVAVHRLRRRYSALLREEIADTLAPHEDVEAELRHLFAVLNM